MKSLVEQRLYQYDKINIALTGITLFSIIYILNLLLYKQTLSLDLLKNSSFFSAAIGGSFYLYFDFFCKGRGWFILSLVSLTFIFVFTITNFYVSVFSSILFIWLLGAIHFILHSLYSPQNHIKIMNTWVYISLPLFIIISKYFLVLSGLNHPQVKDEFLMAIDGSLGIYPSLILGRLFLDIPGTIQDIILFLYLALPVAVVLIYVKRLTQTKEPPYSFIIEIMLLGILGFTLYNIIPGCGANIAFSLTWPDSLPSQFLPTNPQEIYCPTTFPRNCLPSLHTAWVIAILRQAWLCDKITRFYASVLALATLIAMFGIGHYLIDIVVGLSFANVVAGLCSFQLKWHNPARWQATVFGTLLCLTWYILIFTGIPVLYSSKLLAWGIFSGSSILSIYLEVKLFKSLSGM